MVGSGSGIRYKQTKFVNGLYTKRGRIRDPVLFYPPDPGSGSGMEQWSDPDPGSEIKHPVSATLHDILPKILLSSQVSGRISGIRPLPDIRYPAFGLAGYPAGRIYGKNSIWCIPNRCCLLIHFLIILTLFLSYFATIKYITIIAFLKSRRRNHRWRRHGQ
jgi:hypothetical protein